MNKKEAKVRLEARLESLEYAVNNHTRQISHNHQLISGRLHPLETDLMERRLQGIALLGKRPLKYDDIRHGLKLKIVKDFYKGLKGVVRGRQKEKWFAAAKVHVTLEGIGVVTFTLDQVALDDGVSL